MSLPELTMLPLPVPGPGAVASPSVDGGAAAVGTMVGGDAAESGVAPDPKLGAALAEPSLDGEAVAGPGTLLFLEQRPFSQLFQQGGSPPAPAHSPPLGARPMPAMPGALHAPLLGVVPRGGVVPKGALVAGPAGLATAPRRDLTGVRPLPRQSPLPAVAPRGPAAVRVQVSSPVLPAPGNALPSSPPASAASTFGAAPWLVDLAPEAVAPPSSSGRGPAAQPAPVALPVRGPAAVPEGAVLGRGAALAPTAAAEGALLGPEAPLADARPTSAPAVTASVLSAEPAVVEPRVRFQPPPAPVPTRVEVTVRDGDHDLRIAVQRDANGYAVEMRAPREVVPELRSLEGQIDHALQDESGGGLASFDAQAEDSAARGSHAPPTGGAEDDGESDSDSSPGLGILLNRKA